MIVRESAFPYHLVFRVSEGESVGGPVYIRKIEEREPSARKANRRKGKKGKREESGGRGEQRRGT